MFGPVMRQVPKAVNRQNFACLLTLSAFVASAVGLPMTPVGQPSAGCRCGVDRQATSCCCRQALLHSQSCCQTSQVAGCAKPQEKLCCQAAKKTCCPSTAKPGQADSLNEAILGVAVSGEAAFSALVTNEPVSSEPVTNKPASSEPVATVMACGCGGGTPTVGMVINGDPRILPAVVGIVDAARGSRLCPALEASVPGRSVAPETPPPEERDSQTVYV